MYKDMQSSLIKKDFSDKERTEMLKDIIRYIKEKKYRTYYDLMEDICINRSDWFNLLSFDSKGKYAIREYIKSNSRTTRE